MATSRTPNARPRPADRRFRAGFHASAHRGSASLPGADGRWLRIRTVLVGIGLAALMSLTLWAVSSVSAWLVPVYLALMVLIFTAPRGERAASAGESSAGPAGVAVGHDPVADRAAGRAETLLAAEPDPGLAAGEATAASPPRPDPAASGTAKPRRSRARGRKAAKLAAEPVPDSSSVTWIRVGPGKFVRADRGVQAPDEAPVEPVADAHPAPGPPADAAPTTAEALADVHPATDEPTHAAPTSEELVADASPVTMTDASEAATSAPTAPSQAPAEPEPDPLDSPEATPGGEGAAPAPEEDIPGSVAEEYGIAPSAFGPPSLDSPSTESRDRGVPGEPVPVRPESEPGPVADLGGNPSGSEAGSGRLGSPRQRSRARTAFIPRGIANATPRWGLAAASARRHVRTRSTPRISVGFPSGPDRRLEQGARRAFGRIAHVQRARRPRSPPRRPASRPAGRPCRRA